MTNFVASATFGDQLFVHSSGSFVAWAIMYLTHGPWSHVGRMSASDKVFEAIGSGVGEDSVRKYFDGRHYLMWLRLPITAEQAQKLRAFQLEQTGKPYAYAKILRLLLVILTNGHPDYRLKFSIDFLILLGLIAILVPFHAARIVVAGLAAGYLIVLGINSFNRIRAAMRLYKDYLEYASPQFSLPNNSSPNRTARQMLRQPGILLISIENKKKTV